MNGKKGDHPLADIVEHELDVYGREADDLIRKMSALCSRRELNEWWDREMDGSKDRDLTLRKARARCEELLKRARESGWEPQP
ncbi:MAG TPA: hypothetical protein VLQ45_31890 [Thermoanaerobaculia bacterium]|nr:hypothetical protein [Thermoanaerobaculia bacterium]